MSRRSLGLLLTPGCEPFYLNSDMESDEDRRDGHSAQMVANWSEHFDTDRFDTLVDYHVKELKPKLVSPVRH